MSRCALQHAGVVEEIEVVTVVGTSPVATRATAREHEFAIDKPEAAGGEDAGPMASEYFAAALASCQLTTATKIAAKRRQRLDVSAIRAEVHLDGGLISKVVLDLDVRGTVAPDELDTILRLTERSCTISRATSVPIERNVHRVT